MDSGFLRVLLEPGRFFQERMRGEPGLKIPALIALVIGIIGAVSAAISANALTEGLPPDMQVFGLAGVAFAVASGIIGGLITWVAFGIVFYIISMVFMGDGDFKRTLEFTGYGLIPQVFGGIIGAIFSYQIVSNLSVPIISRPEDIAVLVESVTTGMLSDPLTPISGIVGILFLIWSANIWIFGMKYARNLSTRNAVLTVGIPIGLYILVNLVTLIG